MKTITVSEEAARWARKKAAEETTSVSKLVGRKGIDAAGRLSREEAHERR